MAKHRLFSKRNQQRPNNLSVEITDTFKSRLINGLDVFVQGGNSTVDGLLQELTEFLIKEYGSLNAPAYEAARMTDVPVIDHFLCSRKEQSLDFIEALFLQWSCTEGQSAVEYVNNLFDECFLAYRLTDYIQTVIPKITGQRHATMETEYPTIIPISDEVTFTQSIKPALAILSDHNYSMANSELLDAFSNCKTGHYDESITKSCSAYESFIKSICSLKGLSFDPQRDTCSRLVKHLIDAGYLPSWYTPCLESVGTIRNRIGSAHGRGPAPTEVPRRYHAEHMFNLVCSHIQLIYEAQNEA